MYDGCMMVDGGWILYDFDGNYFKIINGDKMNSITEELLQRTFLFGVNTLKFLNSLPYTTVKKVIINQLAKSSTSIGANYEESQAAESKEDFIHKVGIVSKEARESKYWLRVLNNLLDNKKQKFVVNNLLEESEQLCKIFTSIKLTSQENKKKKYNENN